jgi:ComF family protein
LVHLKYISDLGLSEILAENLALILQTSHWDYEIIVPVPASKKRLYERGYNQAAILAQTLSIIVNRPYESRALMKIRETRSQVNLTIPERRKNIYGAFIANTNKVTGRDILIVDDVTTTGATLNACAEALKKAGAKKVVALTVARAPKKIDIMNM